MRERIELEEAQALLTQGLVPLGAEALPLSAALGRTLAADLTAPMDQPPFDRSPLDGYALRAEDSVGAAPDSPVRLAVLETVFAGSLPRYPLEPGTCTRVMTGAMLPPGADCVLRQEDTDLGRETVSVYRSLHPHENFVDRGSDYRAGSLLLPAGQQLDAAALGVLASAGVREAVVRQRPGVAVLTTGDELSPPGEPLPPGRIYDANLSLIAARLAQLGIPVTAAEYAGDDPRTVADTIARLLTDCHFLITTGGVSVGEKDIFHQALPLLGSERVFWRINCKPGTPAMFSRWKGKPILSLSGNPFAAICTFELLARPILAALADEPQLLPRRVTARLDTPFPKASPGRRFIRGRYQEGRVTLPENHQSGVLSSLVGCNCLADLPAGSPPLEAGAPLSILLL